MMIENLPNSGMAFIRWEARPDERGTQVEGFHLTIPRRDGTIVSWLLGTLNAEADSLQAARNASKILAQNGYEWPEVWVWDVANTERFTTLHRI